MRLPPFELDLWLAAHEFATPPIRHNLASSTGPSWTFAELMGLGGSAPGTLDGLTLSYAPPQGGKLLRERIAARHGADPDHVLVMTGASEALIALTCLFAGDGGSIVLPKPAYPAVPVLARAWGLEVREYELNREQGFAQTAD
jgi:DNA-binding transcriptional MocR family regulator